VLPPSRWCVPSVSEQPGRNDSGEHDSTIGPGHRRVDTHLDLHVAAVIDQTGQLLGTQVFPASTRGDVALVAWAERFGAVARIGVEGTGTCGAGLAASSVPRPPGGRGQPARRSTRRRHGKSDPIDAQAAARATLAGVTATTPKTREGQVEMIRVLRVARRGALKASVPLPNNSTGCSPAHPKELRQPCSGSRPRPWSVPVRPCGRDPSPAPPPPPRPACGPSPAAGSSSRLNSISSTASSRRWSPRPPPAAGPARGRGRHRRQLLVTAGATPRSGGGDRGADPALRQPG
jgi:hypothetical protein